MFKDLSKVLIFYWVVLSLVKISWLAIQGSWRLISSKILHQPACIKSLVSILLPYATCPMMKHIMTFLIPDYHTGKLPIKWFQLWFPAHHKKLVKPNEKQSIITKKINPIFHEKSHQRMLWFGWDPSIHQELSDWYLWGKIKTQRGEVQEITENQLFNFSTGVKYII